jgi:uncharacterized damage-inducible protein DinB
MPSFNTTDLINDLSADVRQMILEAENLQNLDDDTLSRPPMPGKWSVGQVLEHLNFYSRFYLKAIEANLHQHKTQPRDTFQSGWFGNYFTNMMKPADSRTVKNKTRAMKSATPPVEVNSREALRQFITDQHQLLNLLQIARSADLGKIRVPISVSKMVRLKLGDTFRFIVAHEQRHFVQIRNTLESLGKSKLKT